MNHKKELFLSLIMPILFSILVCYYCPESASAHTATLTASSSISLDALPSQDGVAIDEESINVTTTCHTGYNLSIATSTDSDLYLNGDNTGTATFTAVDGTSTLANSENKWGYSLTENASSSTIFSPLSTDISAIKTFSETASQTDIDDTFSIYYGTKVANSVTPGSYQMGNNGAIIYYLTMEPTCTTVNISYDGNNAEAGAMSATHNNVGDGDTISLVASNFSRKNYGFAGWSLDPDAGTKLVDNDSTNNPIVYGPQETVTLPVGFVDTNTNNDRAVKLYAVWVPAQGNLQGWSGCGNLDTATYDQTTGALDLTKNSITALKDLRDTNTYAVARLADGNCWMIENLRLSHTASHNSDGLYAQGYGSSNIYGNYSGLAVSESGNFTTTSVNNSLYYVSNQTNSSTRIDIGTSNNPADRMPRYNYVNTNARASNPTSNSAALYSYGNYYTWSAAIADLNYNGTSNQSVTNTSLCPTGWRLPQGGDKTRISSNDDNDFWNLTVDALNNGTNPTNYNSITTPFYTSTTEVSPILNKLKSFPNNFLYSGYYSNTSPANRGSYGQYWSSTAYNSGSSYVMRLYNTSIYPGTNGIARYVGNTVRCIVSNSKSYTLAYNTNGGSGAPSTQTESGYGSATFTITDTTPTRTNYTFNGWIDEKGNEVQPSGSYTTKNTSTTLYAIWTRSNCNPSATNIGGSTTTKAVCLQDVKPNMKNSIATATSTTGIYSLIDARDGTSYGVAKLADGNLWLIKNLNLNGYNRLLTSYDTDLPTGTTFKAPASNGTFETANNIDAYVNPKLLTSSTYGGYYSFASAIASTKFYSSSSVVISTSICPKGWDLPTHAQYTSLKTAGSLNNYTQANAKPYSFIYAGWRDGTGTTNPTSQIRLWTSNVYNESFAYAHTIISSTVYGNNYKRYGESVRCIASNGSGTIQYDANGGSGTMASQSGEINTITIKTNSFTPPTDHKQFRNWCTNADGTGTCVAGNTPASSLGSSDGSTTTLYAQWDDVYTLTFVNTETNSTQSKNAVVGRNANVSPSSTWTRSGYSLIGWDTVTNDGSGTTGTAVYANGQSITPTSDMTFYTVWRPTYSIAYNINTSDANATGTMGNQTNIVETKTVTLLASNFSRSSYGFAGWSLDPNAATNTSAKIYGPQETITAPAYPNSETLNFYAVWVQSAGSIQNTSTVASVCSNLTQAHTDGTANISSISALTDQRDNQTYAIAKLADGKCWMIENLRLEAGATRSDANKALAQGYGVSSTYGNFSGLADSEASSLFANVDTANSLYSTDGSNGTISIDATNASQRFPRYNNTVTANRASSPTTNSSAMYSYGNHYTWSAALANTIYYSSTTGTDADGKTSETVNTSICPAGWRLPHGGDRTSVESGTNDFYQLGFAIIGARPANYNNTMNPNWTGSTEGAAASNQLRAYPNNLVLSGYLNSSITDRGSYGSYWSSTTTSTGSSGFLMRIGNSYLSPTATYGKYYGLNVRCIANTDYTVSFDTNGGTGTMSNQSIPVGTATNLTSNSFTRTDYEFIGWNTAADGSGTSYTNGQSVTDIASPGQTITLYAQWEQNCYAGYICYLGNRADEGTMGRQSATDGNTRKLFASNYSRNGYGFAGWSDVRDYTTNPNAHFYGPNEDIIVPTGTTANGLKLYAVWIQSAGTMQANATSICNDLTATTYSDEGDEDESTWSITANLNNISALTDTRDGQTYAIAKLTDGNCWMIENLRLADTHEEDGNTVATTLTTANTNNPSLPLTNIYDIGSTSNQLSPTSSVAYDANTAPEGWCTSNSVSCSDQSRLRTDNTVNRATYASTDSMSANANLYSYGNYYNWYSTSAGNGTRDHQNNSDVMGDICPIGWHAPTGVGSNTTVSTGELGQLSNILGGYQIDGIAQEMNSSTVPTHTIIMKRFRHFPINLLYSGFVEGASIEDRGSIGTYWTSTAGNTNGARYMMLYPSMLFWPGTMNDIKYFGSSVRCVTRSDYAISFDSNGGTGTMNAQSIPVGTATNLTSNSFTRTGYDFTGWNTSADGTGTSYTNTESVTNLALPGRTITLYAQWEQLCYPGYICYVDNGADEGTMGRQSASDGNTIKLFASNFSRNGYGFAGWSDVRDYTTNPNAHFYGPNEDIIVPTGTTANGLKLYAVWIQSAGTMQANATSICNDLTATTYSDEGDEDESTWSITANLNNISALTDTRDGQTYAIAKLTDGNCWMIENLRLADTHEEDGNTVATTLTTANTNNPSLPLTNIYDIGSTSNQLSPTSSVAYDANTAPEGWCTNPSAACDDQSRINTENTVNRETYTATSNMSYSDVRIYSYGNYYNWYSATAGNGTFNKTSGNTVGDLCPSGWHLPYGNNNTGQGGGDTDEGFYHLANSMSAVTSNEASSKKHRHFPNNYVLPGYILNGILFRRSNNGLYWSSTAYDSNDSYGLNIHSSGTDPGTVHAYKYYGWAVRCVASS